jgi:hypothetical protein
MTWQSETRAWAVASAAAFCLSAVGARVLTAPKLPDLNPTVKHIDDATGAWAHASSQQVASVAAIERDLRVELWHVDRLLTAGSGTLQAAQDAIETANGQLTHVAPLLDAATVTVASIAPAIKQITDDADGIRPILANADGAVTDARAFINQKPLTETLGNIDRLTGEWAAISGDFRQVSDKTTADYLRPVPWYLWPVKRSGELLDIGAAVARHTP